MHAGKLRGWQTEGAPSTKHRCSHEISVAMQIRAYAVAWRIRDSMHSSAAAEAEPGRGGPCDDCETAEPPYNQDLHVPDSHVQIQSEKSQHIFMQNSAVWCAICVSCTNSDAETERRLNIRDEDRSMLHDGAYAVLFYLEY